jgi:hypothetical protein
VKAVIRAFDPMHFPLSLHLLQHGFHQFSRDEWIARSIEAEDGNRDRWKMSVAQFLGMTGRVKWIREEQQSVAIEILRGHHRRGASAHRASADDQRFRMKLVASALDDCGKTFFQSRHRIRAS